ncbi:MAG TPA: hypothetical protein V6D17_18870 [Candidatus Obscuribacterales bacterium]
MGQFTTQEVNPEQTLLASTDAPIDTSDYWVRAENQAGQQSAPETLRENLFRKYGRPTGDTYERAGAPQQTDVPRRPDQPVQRPEASDRSIPDPVVDGALNLKFGEANFDKKLAANPNYIYLNITDIPPGVKLQHSLDENGYFFWYAKEEAGPDGKPVRKPIELIGVLGKDGQIEQVPKRHYYSINAKEISMNGDRRDLEATRLLVNESLVGDQRDKFNGFSSFKKNNEVNFRLPGAPTGRTDALTYFARMSMLGTKALEIQQKSLEANVRTSQNPYFKIYLADIYVTQAMQPIIAQVMNGSRVIDLNNKYTMQKLEDALSLLQAAQGDARDGLGKINRPTQGNWPRDLDPYSIYRSPDDPYFEPYYRRYGYDKSGPMYYFWGGSYDQAAHRQVAITFLRDLIKNNALPRIELPPILPPRPLY